MKFLSKLKFTVTAKLSLLLTALLLPFAVSAADWPSKPVRFVVAFAPGASPDVTLRLMSEKLSAELGQTALVENRPGAGGKIATDRVKRAKPDGYTALVVVSRFIHNPSLYKDAGFDPVNDFEPVINMFSAFNMLVVNKDLGVKSQAELIQLLKDNPGKYNFSSGGLGSMGHLAGELFKSQAGVDAVHIPFPGPAEAIKSVISGESQFAFLTSAQSVPNVKSGNLIALAVTSDTRADLFPDIPTVKEAGLPDFTLDNWQGLVLPKNTPAPVVERLNLVINKVLQDPELIESLDKIGITVNGGTPAEFGQLIQDEQAKWSKIIKDAGISIG